MRALALIAAVAVLATAAQSVARADDCGELSSEEARAKTRRIAETLETQRARTRTWSLIWGIGYGVSAAGFGAAAVLVDDEDRQVDLYVGAGKSTIAALSVVILPVRIATVPDPTADACADLRIAESALADSARSQAKGRGWFKHVGGLLLNVTGVIIAGSQHGDYLRASLLATAGLAVGQLQIWTQPVGARDFERSITVMPMVGPDQAMLSIVGGF